MKAVNRKNLVLASFFCVLTCVLAQISLPILVVPFNLALIGVCLAGEMLPVRFAVLSMVAYWILGFIGIPVFSGMKSGFSVALGPTGGYLFGYVIMAGVLAFATKCRYQILSWMMRLVALSLCYTLGVAWFIMMTNTSFRIALSIGVYPFIWIDLMKLLTAYILAKTLKVYYKQECFFVSRYDDVLSK